MEETIANKEETNMVGMIGKKRKWLTDGYKCVCFVTWKRRLTKHDTCIIYTHHEIIFQRPSSLLH